tara:strand:- start:1983 stop:3467 length:1485 start_codon:yes stop_codon:yes gene_type:complete
MPANSDYSPSMVNEKTSLNIMSSIADSFSLIAKDLVEYVEIKTGKAITPTVDTGSDSLSPTPEINFVGPEKPESKKGFLSKILKMFSPGNILKVIASLAIVAGIVAIMWPSIKEAFGTFFSNIYENIKEGLDKVTQWFSDLFSKAGDLISGLVESTKDFMAPVIESFTGFVSGITAWFIGKFDAIKSFLTGFSLGPPEGETGTPDSNTVDTENVPAFMRSSQDAAPPVPPVKEILKEEISDRSKRHRLMLREAREAKKKRLKSPSQVTNERPVIDGEASSTIPTPTSSSGGMDDVKAMVMQHEGVRYEPYQDSRGLWTVGVGHLMEGQGKIKPEIRKYSHEEVMALFDKDFEHHKKIAEQTPGYGKANESGKAAFVDLAFNMGKWWPKWPNTSDALNQGNFTLAANELKDSAWYGQVGQRADTVVNLVASAGSSQGTTLATSSNSNSIEKRSMASNGQPMVVNSATTTNNTIVKNDVVVASKQENTGLLVARIA